MRTNTVLTILVIALAAIFLPSAGAKAQPNVPILTVDTLTYLGKTEAGEAQGALFLPDGNIIAVWKGRPIIIDSKNGEIIRQLDALPKGYASSPVLSPDGTKLVTRVTGPFLAVWDVPSGKLLKVTTEQTGWPCISKDGTKVYVTETYNGLTKGIISIYDINTLERIDRFIINTFKEAGDIDISPDGQTLAVSVYRKANNEWDKKTNQVILIDLKNNNNYKVIEELEPSVYSMEFSPDGKQIAFAYGGNSYDNTYIYICNLATKIKKFIKLTEIRNIIGPNSGFGQPHFLNATQLIFTSSMPGNPYDSDITVTWDIEQNLLKKIIMFYSPNIDLQGNRLLLCSWNGGLAILDSEYVSVKDNIINNEGYLIYSNSQLEYTSKQAFYGEASIYDTTGKMIANLGTQQFIVGKNIIRINQPLQKGVYILTIKNGTEQSSYKFLVEN